MNQPSLVSRALAVASLCALAACGKPEAPGASGRAKEAAPAAPSAAATAATTASTAPGATGNASITGWVTFEGAAPAAEPIKLSSDAYCAKAHPSGMNKEELVVGPGGALANVFVYVKEGISGTYPAPATPVVLDQKGCAYHPHVFGVMTGQPIDILNSDDTLHNVHAIPEVNKAFNQGMPVPGSKISKTFTKPEVMVRIKCDVHGWMTSWAGVLPHPFFAVSGPDGTFAIKGLPAGTYTLEAWHEKLGTQTLKLTVGENEAKSASFAFKPAA